MQLGQYSHIIIYLFLSQLNTMLLVTLETPDFNFYFGQLNNKKFPRMM